LAVLRLLRHHLSFANVVALLALFVALGGGAYAAFHLPKNSVRSKNIVDGQVKPVDLRPGIASHAYTLNGSANSMPDTLEGPGNPMATLDIGRHGDYVIIARLVAFNAGASDSDTDECMLGTQELDTINLNDVDDVEFDVAAATADNAEVVSLQGATDLSADTSVILSCTDGGDGDVEAQSVKLTAIRVAGLTG
jgi:hypothetical protein